MEYVTYRQLMELMPIVSDKGWHTDRSGCIRDQNRRCPICSLANEIDPEVWFLGSAGRALITIGVDFDPRAIDKMIRVADSHPEERRTRRALMRALGMKS